MIRKAKENEWQDIQRLNTLVYIADKDNDTDLLVDQPYTENNIKYYKNLAKGAYGICFVYLLENKIIGYIALAEKKVYHRKGKYLEIENIGIETDRRGMGFGTELIDESISFAKENGYSKLLVNSYIKNRIAVEFYKKNGFVELAVDMQLQL